ncbi:MAG: ribosome maturation factor RimM [Chloroflexi bacterium]|nr:ribosome maturation factor RimM [Chloroflexota bacterium]
MQPSSNPQNDSSIPDDGIPEGHVAVGMIRVPWGIKGDVKVESLTDVPDRLSVGSVVFLNNTETRISAVHYAGGHLVLHFDAIPDRDIADAMRNVYLTVPEETVPIPSGDSYYHYQLVGLGVWTDTGEELGKVASILETGANDVLVVKTLENKEVLLPAIKDVVLNVDLEKGRITVRMLEYS